MADRLLFSKTGRAKYISHLDLMRTFQRAFARAGIQIKHTEGFHPHPFVSIALPLPVGFSSECEALEFGLAGGAAPEEVPGRMNAVLPEGIAVQRCGGAVMFAKDLSYVNYIVTMEYEDGAPFGAETAIRELLSRESLTATKRSKSGEREVDIIPCIARSLCVEQRDAVILDLTVRAKDPGLNPELVTAAIRRECPGLTPDYLSYHRKAVLNEKLEPWL